MPWACCRIPVAWLAIWVTGPVTSVCSFCSMAAWLVSWLSSRWIWVSSVETCCSACRIALTSTTAIWAWAGGGVAARVRTSRVLAADRTLRMVDLPGGWGWPEGGGFSAHEHRLGPGAEQESRGEQDQA